MNADAPVNAVDEALEGLRHRLLLEIGEFAPDQREVLHRETVLAERTQAHDRRSKEPYTHHYHTG